MPVSSTLYARLAERRLGWAQPDLMTHSMNITDSRFQIEASLALTQDEVQLWRADLEAIRGDESRWEKLLSTDEAARASRFHFARDRQCFVAGRALLRIILARYLGREPAELRFSYSKKEKPALDPTEASSDLAFNISHSGGIALLAFSRGREIGVDIEQVRPNSDLDAIARRFFSKHEQQQLAALSSAEKIDAFFRCWTRKEAYVKATGDGLSLPLSQFDVSIAPEEMNALLATRPDGKEASRWLIREVTAGSGYTAALCVRGGGWKLTGWSQQLQSMGG
jgi:4'-phosphopantetheinyl transferase